MLQCWGGEAGIRLRLSTPNIPGTGDSRETIYGMAVRAGKSFHDWAIILQHKSAEGGFCTQCPQVHHCLHLSAGSHNLPAEQNTHLDADRFEAKLGKDYNIHSGIPSLICDSIQHPCLEKSKSKYIT